MRKRKECVTVLMVCNRLLSELEGPTCKAHVRSWTSLDEDVSMPLKFCCPLQTASKFGIMVIWRGWNAKSIFHLLLVYMIGSDPASVRCSQICLDRYFIVWQLLKSQMRFPKHYSSLCALHLSVLHGHSCSCLSSVHPSFLITNR